MSRDGAMNVLNGGISNSTSSSGISISAQSSASNLQTPCNSNAKSHLEEEKVPSIFPKLKPIRHESNVSSSIMTTTPLTSVNQLHEKPPNLQNANNIYTEHIHPKSIIQKFEQLVQKNNNMTTIPSAPVIENTTTTIPLIGKNQSTSNRSSLTYVSSGVSESSISVRSNFDQDDEDQNVNNNNNINNNNDNTISNIMNNTNSNYSNQDQEAIYEELGNENELTQIQKSSISRQQENTSLFEDDYDQETTTTANNNNDNNTNEIEEEEEDEEPYSLSSTYSGSIINKEFEDMDNDEYDDRCQQDLQSTTDVSDIYSCYDDQSIITTTIRTDENSHDPSEKQQKTLSFANDVLNMPVKSSMLLPSINESTTTTSTTRETDSDQFSEPLFSIREYRKQKKYPRRSSILNSNNNNNKNQHQNKCKQIINNKINSITNNANTSNGTTQSSSNIDDLNNKKNKYLERIKVRLLK
jgi:hypothetical protein